MKTKTSKLRTRDRKFVAQTFEIIREDLASGEAVPFTVTITEPLIVKARQWAGQASR